MDPFTAIGFAAAITGLIDFSCTLVKGIRSIKEATGLTDENDHIERAAKDLEKATKELDAKLTADPKHGEELTELAKQCVALSKELDTIFGHLRAPNKKNRMKKFASKVAVTVSSMLKEKEIAGIEKRLGEYRQQIILRLNLMML